MSASVTLATSEHLDRLLALVEAFHIEAGLDTSPEQREAGVKPLLDGIPHGVVYLIGPPKAPIGYIVISFGWSVEFGGMDGFIDEFFIRPGVRNRGIASEVLLSLPKALGEAGLCALHLEVATENPEAQKLYSRRGFDLRSDYHLMTRRL